MSCGDACCLVVIIFGGGGSCWYSGLATLRVAAMKGCVVEVFICFGIWEVS